MIGLADPSIDVFMRRNLRPETVVRIPLSLAAALAVVAIAFGANPAAAAPGDTVFALTSNNTIISFAPSSPATTTAPVAITGLNAGENILGIDFRPANNQLYALGSSSQLYTINTSTGAATKVGGTFATPLAGTQFGFDFNPVADRIRVVSSNRRAFLNGPTRPHRPGGSGPDPVEPGPRDGRQGRLPTPRDHRNPLLGANA